ncbi:MAG: hypothetical protein E6289_18170 [Clostridium sp.]|nr:hypothetical protein [Clostridium sp.]MDU7179818.1 hypothetical protein [Clostridium sp.]
MEYILTLTFMTETGKKNSLTISGVKEDVAYISKVEAKLTQRKITTFDAE